MSSTPIRDAAILLALTSTACFPAALSLRSSGDDASDDGQANGDAGDASLADRGGDVPVMPSGCPDGSPCCEAGKCPSSLSLGMDRHLTGVGDDGGQPKSVHCGAGAFVTRVDSFGDDPGHHASGVAIYCATPALVQGPSSYSVTLTPDTPAPYKQVTGTGNPTDDRQDSCGGGLSAITYTVGLADIYVEGLGNHCGSSAVTLQPDNTITFDFTGSGDTSYRRWGDAGATFDLACQSNEVVVGFDLRVGAWLNQIAPICASLDVVYQ